MTKLEERDKRWDTLVKRGKDAGRDKDIVSSAQYFLAAYDLSKTFPRSDRRRGESAFLLGFTRFVERKNSEAARLFKEYLEYPAEFTGGEDRLAHVHSLLGSIYFGSDQLEQAELHIRNAQELENKLGTPSWENNQFLASVLMMQKKYLEAIPALTELFNHQRKVDVQAAQKVAVMIAFAHKQLDDEKGELLWQKKNLELHEIIRPTVSSDPPLVSSLGELPEGWGLDQLGHFLEACRRNELSTYVQKSQLYARLSQINDRFIENRKSMVLALTKLVVRQNPPTHFSDIELKAEEWLEVYFYLRCHASFAAAVRLALSAQLPETFMVLRGCIENALYAWHVSGDESLKRIWLDRHNDESSARDLKRKFAIGDMKRNLLAKDTALGTKVNAMYDESIDRGAHPNVMAFLSNAVQTNADGQLILTVTTLNPDRLDEILEATISTGNLVFEIYKLIYPNLIE